MRLARLPVLGAALLLAAAACNRPAVVPPQVGVPGSPDPRAAAVHPGWLRGLDSLAAGVDRLIALAPAGDAPSVQAGFVAARAAWKRVEAVSEYFAPTTAELINGPALDRVEEDEGDQVVLPPEGFQVLEELVFPGVTDDRTELERQARVLRANVERLRAYADATVLTDANLFDALRMEVARIVTLGVTGFDSPVALASLPEAVHALDGIGAVLATYLGPLRARDPALADTLAGRLEAARNALRTAPSFDDFDRMGFVVRHANPLARALARARDVLGIAVPDDPRAWVASAPTLFEAGAFDPQAFAPPWARRPDAAMVALGAALFRDPVLSGAGDRSCASCHEPGRAFTDGLPRSRPLRPRAAPLRNAPTLLNAGLQAGSFADLRTAYLEDQVTDVVGNADEMHGSLDAAAAVLRRGPLAAQFAAVFGSGDSAVTGQHVREAVAAYVRSLVALDSRFDRHVRGDTTQLSPAEARGFNLFMGKAKCGTCHFAPLFNGTVPPAFREMETEVLGTPERPAVRAGRVDPDPGRAAVTRAAIHRHAFKTPTARNAALTAPYMHNGVYRTLEDLVDFYDRGGGAGIGIGLANQTLPPDPLRLTPGEKRDLVAFMGALTDTVVRPPAPVRGPAVASARVR